MAIRFPLVHSATWGGTALPLAAAVQSGWTLRAFSRAQADPPLVDGVSFFQPGRMSRPGNLGTAYSGVWTENVASANDAHRPIPFKLLTAASLIYDTGLTSAIMGM